VLGGLTRLQADITIMAQPTHEKTDRVNLVYKTTIGDSVQEIELPFRLLVLADFSCNQTSAAFDNQEPIVLSSARADSLYLRYRPEISIRVKNVLIDDADELVIQHAITSIDSFHPKSIINEAMPFTELLRFVTDLGDIVQHGSGSAVFDDDAYGAIIRDMLDAEGMTFEQLDQQKDNLGWLVSSLERRIALQLDEILHHPDFMRMEAAWRSLDFLLQRTDFSENCEIAVLNVSKDALMDDFEDSPEVVRTQYFQTVYSSEFGQFGGRPYAAIVANYEFGPQAHDIRLLQRIASVSAIAHAPFIAAASAEFFSVDSYAKFSKLRDIRAIFQQPTYAKWNSFRETPDARYIGLTLPPFLLRKPYEAGIGPIDYRETVNRGLECMLWGSSAFAFATRLLDSFARYRWCLNVTGKDEGLVDGLSVSDVAGDNMRTGKIPTQILLTDKREAEVVAQGFIPLSVHKGDDTAAFYSAYSAYRIGNENRDANDLAERLGAQIPYLMIVSRISHYIKMMQREHIGSWKNRHDIDQELNIWLKQYVSDMDNPAPGVRGRRPLRRAEIKVREVEGKGDWYLTKIQITPHIKYMGTQFTLSETSKLEKA
jgi:type VI secretion system protein ImpC